MKKELRDAVINQVGVSLSEFTENASDYFNASNGISGFTYYGDTHKFALDNQTEINELLQELAENQGVEVVELVKHFGVFSGEMDNEELKDLYRFLGDNNNMENYETNSVLNALSWLCVEQLAFELSE